VRIVLDTNVVLSALLWRGTPYRLLEGIRQRSDAQRIEVRGRRRAKPGANRQALLAGSPWNEGLGTTVTMPR